MWGFFRTLSITKFKKFFVNLTAKNLKIFFMNSIYYKLPLDFLNLVPICSALPVYNYTPESMLSSLSSFLYLKNGKSTLRFSHIHSDAKPVLERISRDAFDIRISHTTLIL